MKPSSTHHNKTNDDITLYGLISLFIRNWLILVISGFTFAIVAVVWAIQQPNIYKAEALLMPASGEDGGLGGLAGKLGGLASVAGVNLASGKDNNTKLALELVESRVFIDKFVNELDIKVELMAANGWNVTTGELLIDPEVYDKKTGTWLRKVEPPKMPEPSKQEIYEKFISMLDVEEDPKTKFVKVSIEYYSPQLAAQWVTKLVDMLNQHIRELDKDEATRSINYLKDISDRPFTKELKTVIATLTEEQLKSRMLTEVRKDYVYKIVDPAVAPENKSKPKRALIVVLAGFIGGIIGIIIILFRAGKPE